MIGAIVGAGSGAYETAFYEATAQIIPVLLLVLAVEARFFRIDLVPFKQLRASFETEVKDALGDDPSPGDVVRAAFELPNGQSFAYVQQRLLMALALATLVAGEVASVLILGKPGLTSNGLQGLVLGATFAGLGAVTVAALTGPMPVANQPSQGADATGKDEDASGSDG
ncbi:MAG TPA: hypothetical protein VN756_11270 [Solirubrobacterales bacterium]|nr:hypothetical protein [Solirubrobacterales bacterium]